MKNCFLRCILDAEWQLTELNVVKSGFCVLFDSSFTTACQVRAKVCLSALKLQNTGIRK